MEGKRWIAGILIALLPIMPGGRMNAFSVEKGERVTVIVEVKGDAVLETREAVQKGSDGYRETRAAKRQEERILRTQATVQTDIEKTVSADAEIGYTYTYLLNGFSMEVYESDIDRIRALPDVEAVWVAEDIPLDDPVPGSVEDVQAAVDNCCRMMGIDAAHEAGYRGEGTVIAVIDSEFDVGHEFFASAPDDPTKIKYTKADIGALMEEKPLSTPLSANQVYRSAKIPFQYNYGTKNADTYSSVRQGWHGTHVAGIAAGKSGALPNGDTFDGTAPEAQLILMSASLNSGRNIDDALAFAAMDDAAKLGADAINLSFGTKYKYNDANQTQVINAARNAGIFVAASAGNFWRGYDINESVPVTMPDYATSGTPANADGATTVASVNNDAVWNGGATVSLPGGDPIFVRDMRNFLTAFPAGSTLSYTCYGQGTVADFQGVDATGRVAVILRGNGTFNEKVTRAAAAGAVGVILVNNAETDANPMVTEAVNTPVGWINHYSDGAVLFQNATGSLTVGEGFELRSAQPGISYFSSWGTNVSLDLKPEIATAGHNIYSSYPDDQYTILSGTSMAAPHAAGAAAILTQYIKAELPDYAGNRAALIENLMMSTATPVLQLGTEVPYSPRVQGAGLLNLASALETPVVLCGSGGKSKLNLGELGDAFTLSFDAVNLSDATATYDEVGLSVLTDDYSTGENGENAVAGTRELAHTVSAAPNGVTVPANGSQTVSVAVSLDAAALAENSRIFTNGFFVEGFVTLRDSTGSLPELHIPFMGFYGGWERSPIIDPVGGRTGKTTATVLFHEGISVKPGQNPVMEEMKKQDASGYAADYEANAGEYEGAAYAAWSPNGDGCMDEISLNVYYLRTATGTAVKIINEQNEERTFTVLSGLKEKYSQKSYKLSDDAEEGVYTFTVKGRAVETAQSLPLQAFPIATLVCDKTPPTVTGYSVTSENDTDILSLSLSDNRYVAGVILCGEDADQASVTRYYPTLPEEETALAADISDLNRETLTVTAYDYAGNSTRLAYGVFVSDGDVTPLGNGMSAHTFEILNTTERTPSAWCAAVLYENGRMVGLDARTVTVTGGISSVSFTLPDTSYDTRKLLIWDSRSGMLPLSDSPSTVH